MTSPIISGWRDEPLPRAWVHESETGKGRLGEAGIQGYKTIFFIFFGYDICILMQPAGQCTIFRGYMNLGMDEANCQFCIYLVL